MQRIELRSRELIGYGFFANLAIHEAAAKCPGLDGTLHASGLGRWRVVRLHSLDEGRKD